MLSIILPIILLCQPDPAFPIIPRTDTRGKLFVNIKFYDWSFEEAQEEFVMETSPQNLYKTIPPNILKWVKRLSTNCYKCREIADKKLQKLPYKDYIWLWWAQRTFKDLETQKHLYLILMKKSICSEEHGDYKCQSCLNAGYFWPLSILQITEKRISVLVRDKFELGVNEDWIIPN